MEQPRSASCRSIGSAMVALVLHVVLSSLVGLAVAQGPTIPTLDCSVTIRQPTSSSYTTVIDCTGEQNPDFVVVVQNATAIGNVVTYTLNGVTQELGSPGFTEDGSQLWSSWTQLPALVGMGMTSISTQQGAVVVRADVVNITLPQVAVQASIAGPVAFPPSVFSVLRFSTISNVTILGSVFDGITSIVSNQGYATVAWMDDMDLSFELQPAVTVADSVFSRIRGSNTQSGALTLSSLALNSYGAVTITNTSFSAISAPSNGAAVHLALNCVPPSVDAPAPACPSLVTISDCAFDSSNSTLGRGGAVFISGGSALVQNSRFTNNRAGTSGGALMFDPLGTDAALDITNTLFYRNVAGAGPLCNANAPTGQCNVETECGGAVRVVTSTILPGPPRLWFGSAVVTVTNSLFHENRNDQVNTGGAVCIGRDQSRSFAAADIYRLPRTVSPESTAVFRNTRFSDNYIPRAVTTGGAVFDLGSDGLTFDNCTFANNTAGRGAAIYSLWGASVTITGRTIVENCIARRQFGGAVAVSDLGSNLTVRGATFRNNLCNTSDTVPPAVGGALYIERQLIENPSLPNFTATITDTAFLNNICQEAGAVFIRNVPHTIGPNVLFDGNRAHLSGSAGGALYIQSLIDPEQLPTPLSSNINGTTFRSNRADSNGGALYTLGMWDLRIVRSSFDNNSVSDKFVMDSNIYSGGAVYINPVVRTPVRITGSRFNSNTALQGGALAILNSNLTLLASTFDSNTAVNAGGAVRVLASDPGYHVNIVNSSFTGNHAALAGALQVVQAGLWLQGSRLSGNTAEIWGGAMSLEVCGPTDPEALPLYAPVAWTDPQMEADTQSAYIFGSLLLNNTAAAGGGAVYATASRVVVVSTNLSNNRGGSGGGAIHADQSSTINTYRGLYEGNQGARGGAVYAEGSNLTFNATVLRDNQGSRGGAVFAGLTRGDLRATGQAVAEFTNCTAIGNGALVSSAALDAGYGGFLSAEGVNVTLLGGYFNDNNAAVAGGVVDARGTGCTLVVRRADWVGNDAWVKGGTISAEGLDLVHIDNSTIRNGNTFQEGGCVWASGSSCMIITNTRLSNCESISGNGGAAWISLPGTGGCSASALATLDNLSVEGQTALNATAAPEESQPDSTPVSPTLNLVLSGVTVTDSHAVRGGGLTLQPMTGAAAVLDLINVTGCSAQLTSTCGTGTEAATAASLFIDMPRQAAFRRLMSMQRQREIDAYVANASVNVTSSALGSRSTTCPSAASNATATSRLQVTLTNTTVVYQDVTSPGDQDGVMRDPQQWLC